MDAKGPSQSLPRWLASAAIALWSTLAWYGVELATVPPFLIVGCALLVAGLGSLPLWYRLSVAPTAVALGIYGLFGFHFFLFMALRYAPAVPANLVNYLWPLLIVVLAPCFQAHLLPSLRHLCGALIGLAGATLAMTGAGGLSALAADGRALAGYGFALVSAFIWASYSLASQRAGATGPGFPTAAVGLFCAASGILALICHAALEPAVHWTPLTILLLVTLGIGPMGGAFFLWDAALKRGDARSLGSLAYLTPILSTLLLAASGHGRIGWSIAAALVLVVGGAILGASGTRRLRMTPTSGAVSPTNSPEGDTRAALP